jgi:hypothetical protein
VVALAIGIIVVVVALAIGIAAVVPPLAAAQLPLPRHAAVRLRLPRLKVHPPSPQLRLPRLLRRPAPD